jgi:glucosamine-6-phosphate deaminase
MSIDLYSISADELTESARIPVVVANSVGEIHYEFAIQMYNEIVKNNEDGKKSVFICPCGPTEQYEIFTRLVNTNKVSLKDTWIINMDEYIMDDGNVIDENDRFSFKRVMDECLYSKIDEELIMPKEQRVFPDPKCPEKILELINQLGGVDITFGGVALNGHVAFNEPEPEKTVAEFAELSTRIVELSMETRVKDAILGRGGAVDTVPKRGITVGMKEILGAKKLRLSMTNDMQRAVVRKALHGEITASCPVTFAQSHEDAVLYITKNVTEKPF